MRYRYKISIVILLLLTAVFFLVKYQARRIVTNLIESNTQGAVKLDIGSINIHLVKNSVQINSLSLFIKEQETPNYRKVNIKRVYIDVASLWDFLSGGTLIIEKLECEGAELTLFNNHKSDSTTHAFNLNEIIERLKKDAIRFSIQDMVFKDVNLILTKDTLKAPTAISHFNARAQHLNLSEDSLSSKKPLVEFNLPKQVILLPNELTLGFDSLSFTTQDNSVQLVKLDLKSPPSAASNTYHVYSDKVRISNFNFESLYKTGRVYIDSIFLGKSGITADWTVKHADNSNASHTSIPAIPYADIHSILFDELKSDVTIRNGSVDNNFNIERASLQINDFKHNPDSSRVIYSPYYNLLITRYSTFLGDSSKFISFDTIQIQKHSMSLLNFSYKTTGQKQPLIQTPRFELKNVDWYEFLINRKLVADELLITEPTIITTIKKSENSTGPVDTFKVVETLNSYFNVNLFSVRDARAYVDIPDKNLNIILNGYSTTIVVSDLINSNSVNQGLDAIRFLSFKNLRLENPDFNADVRKFRFANRNVSVGVLSFQKSAELLILTEGLNFDKVSWSEPENSITLEGLGWDGIKAEIRDVDKSEKARSNEKVIKMPVIDIKSIVGGKADVFYSKQDLNLKASLNHLYLKSLTVDDSLRISGVDLSGNSIFLGTDLNDIRIGTFSMTDTGGEVSNIWVNRNTAEYLNLMLGRLSFKTNLQNLLRNKFELSELKLDGIRARYHKQNAEQSIDLDFDGRLVANDLDFHQNEISIGSVFMQAGPFMLESEKLVKDTEKKEKKDLKSKRLKLNSDIDSITNKNKTIKSFSYLPNRSRQSHQEKDTSSVIKKRIQLGSKNGNIKFYLTDIHSRKTDTVRKTTSNINRIEFSEIDFESDKLMGGLKQGSLDNLIFNSERTKNIWNIIEDNQHTAELHTLQGSITVNDNLIKYGKLDYHPQSTSTSIKQFEFRPLKDRQQFLDDNFYQSNYLATKIESISLNRLDFKRLLEDTIVHFGIVNVSSPNLEIGRDKTHPFLATGVKPLPTNAFQKLKVGFKIDTLKVSNGKISYTEKSRITGKEGTINFSQMDALVRNVKNIDLSPNDSLYIRASTQFMDSANVRLRVRESYGDTLAGFLLTTQVSPFNTSILNKALVPMVSVDFKSGFVDTLYMKAIGREYLALGSMKFLYHDLKVEFLDKTDTSRHSLKNQLLKFAANTFVVKSKNNDRTGKIYYERDRNRAVFQYWVKMILSGVTTSAGAKSNKKQIKKYMKQLNQKKLPPIDDKFDL